MVEEVITVEDLAVDQVDMVSDFFACTLHKDQTFCFYIFTKYFCKTNWVRSILDTLLDKLHVTVVHCTCFDVCKNET